jgi:hypothetical protein
MRGRGHDPGRPVRAASRRAIRSALVRAGLHLFGLVLFGLQDRRAFRARARRPGHRSGRGSAADRPQRAAACRVMRSALRLAHRPADQFAERPAENLAVQRVRYLAHCLGRYLDHRRDRACLWVLPTVQPSRVPEPEAARARSSAPAALRCAAAGEAAAESEPVAEGAAGERLQEAAAAAAAPRAWAPHARAHRRVGRQVDHLMHLPVRHLERRTVRLRGCGVPAAHPVLDLDPDPDRLPAAEPARPEAGPAEPVRPGRCRRCRRCLARRRAGRVPCGAPDRERHRL